jgi:hypothetical protein
MKMNETLHTPGHGRSQGGHPTHASGRLLGPDQAVRTDHGGGYATPQGRSWRDVPARMRHYLRQRRAARAEERALRELGARERRDAGLPLTSRRRQPVFARGTLGYAAGLKTALIQGHPVDR